MKITHMESTQREVTDNTICDLCGGDIDDGVGWYAVNEVTIEHRKGLGYPEGSYGHEIKPDICPACWCSIILPFLREKGLKIPYKEYDY